MTTETQLIVRYAETDQMGIVHHSVYPVWFEAARTDFLKQAGISYSKMESEGFLLPLAEMHCQFKNPAHYEDEIIIQTKITKMTFVKLFFEYRVFKAADYQLLAEGGTTHACTSKSLKPVNLAKGSPELYKAINELVEKEHI
jgi:acyl-CoA thioester hydrolase